MSETVRVLLSEEEVYSQESHQLIGKGRVRLASADLEAGKAEGVLIHRNDWVSL